MVVRWYLLSPSLIPLASVHSRGTRHPAHVSFVTTPLGAMSQEHLLHEESSHGRLWPPLLKLKFGNGWLTSNCCGSSCKKIQFRFSIPIPIPIPGFSIPIPFSIPSIPIPIPELELELSCNSNSGIELTPTLRPVLAFGYCRCLHLCVCVSVCVCQSQAFHTIRSPNLAWRYM